MEDIRSYLNSHTLLFDGAMGTYYAAKHGRMANACEMANLTDPEDVYHIHREYLEAGARAIKTNTFNCNRTTYPEEQCSKILEAGWKLAVRAASQTQSYVFADIGPIPDMDGIDLTAEYRFLADRFLELGARHFLFETNSTLDGLEDTFSYIKAQSPDCFILVSFAVMPDGFTAAGLAASRLLKTALMHPAVDAAGCNCVSGSRHMVMLIQQPEIAALIRDSGKAVSIMPNAGYPTVAENRMVYQSASGYFTEQIKLLSSMGIRILGGCCGTTPEYIAAVSKAFSGETLAKAFATASQVEAGAEHGAGHAAECGAEHTSVRSAETGAPGPQAIPAGPEDDNASKGFWAKLLDSSVRPYAVELDPPDMADTAKFMAGVEELQANGADIITIADCPIARARMDSSLLACKIRRELGMEALPHMTCRDRNLNATKALLLGLYAEEIRNVLIITGDPIPSASRDEIKSVFNFNSRMLANYIRTLGETVLPEPFHIFGALNVNAVNFHSQLESAKKKIDNGVCGFLTQPILTAQALENLKLARKTLDAKILGGIIPIVSYRNAMFMNSEVSGITVDEKVIAMYEGADREKGEELAVRISTEIASRIAEYIDGFYLITPFGRAGLISRIIHSIENH